MSKDDTLEPAIEIVVQGKPRDIERSTEDILLFKDLRPYLQIGRNFSVVNRLGWSNEAYEYKSEIPEKYNDIVRTDIYRTHGKIETIEYDILVEDYENYRKKSLYKHIDENHIKATPGKLLIISGFSGAGKGTVIQQLLTEYPEKYVVSVSATTRKPRKGEVDGKSYYFKKREEFEDLINKNEFLEFAEYAGEYYGTLKKDVYKNYFKGKNVIIEIDSQGARQIRENKKFSRYF